jgi:hypothetical protein
MKSQTGKARNKRKPWGRVLLVTGLYLLALALPQTPTQAAGGKSIASATPVVYGQQEFGNTANDQYLEDSCGFGTDGYRSYWAASVLAGDLLTINWEATHGTELKLMPVGTTDYTLFQTNPVISQELSSNNKNQAVYTAPQAGLMPLYFRVCTYSENVAGPYDFTVTDQHALVVGLQPYLHIKSTTVLSGSVHLADGSPIPDGLAFTLTATWPGNGTATYSASTVGNNLSFPLALPASAQGQIVTFTVTRPADLQYQAAKSAELKVKVARPKPEAVTPPRHHHPRRCRRGFH